MTKHTPTPWRLTTVNYLPTIVAYHPTAAALPNATGDVVMAMPGPHFDKAERDANAALIVRAVNSHDELVAALRAMVDAYKDSCPDDEQPSMVRQAIAILAKLDA